VQDVQRAERLDRRLHHRLDLVHVPEVDQVGTRLTAALADLVDHHLSLLETPACDQDAGALASQQPSGGRPDAGRPAGDDRDLPCDPPCHAAGLPRLTCVLRSV